MFGTPPFPSDAPRFGDGRFVVVSRIGQGRTGAVYRGYDLAHQQWRAFKLLNAELAADWEAWDRFIRDGLLLARTSHPNLVRVHEVIGGRAPFLVMDLVTGGTLQRWIERNGPMPPRMACSAVLEVARGLAAIHASGGVHGAIGPGNVLVTSQGVRQLSDLSAALDPDERAVDVAALGDLLRRLCGADLPPKLAGIASGSGVGSLQIAADVAAALERVRAGLPEDPPGTPEPVLHTTGGERAVRTASLPPELARLVGEPPAVSLLSEAITQPSWRRTVSGDPTVTGETLRVAAAADPEPTDSGSLTADATTDWNVTPESTRWHRVIPPGPDPDSGTLGFQLDGADPTGERPEEPSADPDSVTVPRLGGAAGAEISTEVTGPTTPMAPLAGARVPARPDARLPIGVRPRVVTRPAPTAEQPRSVGAPSGSYDEQVFDDASTERTDRDCDGFGSDPSASEPSDPSLFDLLGSSASATTALRPRPAPRGAVPALPPPAATPEPPPLPPHLLRSAAVAPRTVVDGDATPLPDTARPAPAPEVPAAAVGPGCLSMVMVPASAAFGLTLAAVALFALLVGTAARDLAARAAAVEVTRAELHEALEQHVVVIDRLAARSTERERLEAAFRAYIDARGEPERTRSALALVDTVDRVGALHEDGAELSYRLKQIRSARTDYDRAVHAWRLSSQSPRGRLVIAAGLAPGPDAAGSRRPARPDPD